MTIQMYVSEVLQVPVTIVGYNLIVEAIEITLDTKDFRFYTILSEATGRPRRYLEKAIRTAKDKSLTYMDESTRRILHSSKVTLTNTEYILAATKLYREEYEDKE